MELLQSFADYHGASKCCLFQSVDAYKSRRSFQHVVEDGDRPKKRRHKLGKTRRGVLCPLHARQGLDDGVTKKKLLWATQKPKFGALTPLDEGNPSVARLPATGLEADILSCLPYADLRSCHSLSRRVCDLQGQRVL